jgi:tellurite resistance protein TerA
LDKEQKLSDDSYMTFFNQPKTPCGAVELNCVNNSVIFTCVLSRLPSTIDRLVFTAATDSNKTMNSISEGYLRFQESSQFLFTGHDFSNEKAIMLGELYRKDGAWRFMANGQGFNGGLSALVKHFGGEVSEENIPQKPEKETSSLSLSKITLEKSGDKISLDKPKNNEGYGEIICNLNWSSDVKKGFFGGSKKIDLDLACLFELNDGWKGVVQALGESFGSYDSAPFIYLDGDDTTGKSELGEFIYINGDYLKEIKRICVFAFIYDGIVKWKEANAVVTVNVPNNPIIEVKIDSSSSQLSTCAIAMIENENGNLKVTKLDKYFSGHRELDKYYKWGMNWKAGSK